MADEEDTVDTRAMRAEPCERHSRRALIAHLRERIALGQLGGEAQLRAVARSPRLLEDLEQWLGLEGRASFEGSDQQ